MKISPLGKTLLVFMASYGLLLLFFSQFGHLYFNIFQGIFRWEIDALFAPFRVTNLTTETHQGQAMIALYVELTDDLFLKDGTVLLTKGRPYFTKTIAINQYLHPIIIFSILLAWPGLIWRDRFKLFLLAMPFLLALEMVDIPLLLAIRCKELMEANLLRDPFAGRSLGSYWASFLHTGGRAALSVLGAGLALGIFYLIRVRRQRETSERSPSRLELARTKTGRNDPCPCGSGRKYKHCCGSK